MSGFTFFCLGISNVLIALAGFPFAIPAAVLCFMAAVVVK